MRDSEGLSLTPLNADISVISWLGIFDLDSTYFAVASIATDQTGTGRQSSCGKRRHDVGIVGDGKLEISSFSPYFRPAHYACTWSTAEIV